MIKIIIFKDKDIIRTATLDIDKRHIKGETDEQVIIREATALTAGPWIAKAPKDCPKERPQFWIVDFETGQITVKSGAAAAAEKMGKVVAIKAEANRRILIVADKNKQDNLTAAGGELTRKELIDKVPLSKDEKALILYGQNIWDQIKLIRKMSNKLEKLIPIPEDFIDDKYWY